MTAYSPRFVADAFRVISVAALLGACSPDSGINDGAGGSGAGSNTGGPGSGGDDGTTGTGFGTGNSSTSSLMECASESIEAKLAPLTMFIAFDKSGSMDNDNKWENATNALKAFFGDPTTEGLEVALRFFPDGACSESQCDVGACATPEVDAGALTADPAPTDTQEQALVQAIDSKDPGGGTPISAALQGGTQWATGYLAANPEHKVVVILVTDGEPQGCNEDIDAIANIAAGGFASGVPTYTVGLEGSNEGELNQVAAAGGSEQGFFIGNGNAEQELLDALQAIRGEQLACEIDIPEPTEGEFNPMLVNVTYKPGDGGAEQTFGNVANEGACTANGGWYYDNPADPQNIILCPSTCDSVQLDPEGAITVVLGCETIPG